jgi:hypothetical protein
VLSRKVPREVSQVTGVLEKGEPSGFFTVAVMVTGDTPSAIWEVGENERVIVVVGEGAWEVLGGGASSFFLHPDEKGRKRESRRETTGKVRYIR